MKPIQERLACKWAATGLLALVVFLAFFAFTVIVYRSTLFDIPRSDHIQVFAIFQNLKFPADITKIAFMELLGQARFQPLTWLLHFFQIKAFGFNFFLHHLVVVGVHALNGMLAFQLVYSLSRKALFSFLAALVFVSLFTHLVAIAWPVVAYSLISVTLSLLALLSLLKFHQSSRIVFLYLSYAAAFVMLFLYELNIIVPAILFLFSLALGWSATGKRSLILKNLFLTAVIYVVYAGLYLVLMPKYAGLPHGILSIDKIVLALAGVPIEFVNTAFMHNIFASSQIIFGELSYYVPFTAKSFSVTTTDPSLVKLNFLVYLALLALAITVRRPRRGPILWLLVAWAVGYTIMLFLGRHVSYVISQARHAYFPSLLLIIVLAHFYERYFSQGWSLAKQKGSSFIGRYGGSMVLIACVFFIGLNTVKISWALNEYMEYRAYSNAVYYTARDWLSTPENEDNRLFISVTTYPPHEKMAWGADIIPDLFLDDPRITKNFQQATHILEWQEGEESPAITELRHSAEDASSDDFAVTFGIFSYITVTEPYLEVFAAPAEPELEAPDKRWWLRLFFGQGIDLPSDVAGIARVGLGYSQGASGYVTDGWVFLSQPVSIPKTGMAHIVLVRENKTFGLIVNGTLMEKVQDITDEDLRNLELSLGKFLRSGYRKPYYYAHTFVEFGRSSYSIQDKEIGYVFDSIRFDPKGGREEHISLNW